MEKNGSKKERDRNKPLLWIIVPCYNEEKVLPKASVVFLDKLNSLISAGLIDEKSRILFVNDGSTDDTWEIIKALASRDEHVAGIAQSRNRGHQNAVLAGLMEARDNCDITISIDCDGQDDINAMDRMIEEYRKGSEIVYGVRSSREKDSWFKKTSAENFYKFLKWMGADVVYNHADYRLVSARVLNEFADFGEVNLYLRGLFPLVGFPSSCVYYERQERMAGKSHYPLGKMLALAFDGTTSLTIKPIRMITVMGFIVAALSLIGVLWSVICFFMGRTVSGWASMTSIICFLGGMQLCGIGVIGEYVGKTYLEVKHRPRYIISERTGQIYSDDDR